MCGRRIQGCHSPNLKQKINKNLEVLNNWDKWHTLKWAKSSSLVRSNSSKYKEYTSIQPYTLITENTAPNKIMVKLYPNIGSLAIDEKSQAINRNIRNAAKENSHGTILFSCSWKIIILLKYTMKNNNKFVLPCVEQILRSSWLQKLQQRQQMKTMRTKPIYFSLKHKSNYIKLSQINKHNQIY